jgi:hypothetical protein
MVISPTSISPKLTLKHGSPEKSLMRPLTSTISGRGKMNAKKYDLHVEDQIFIVPVPFSIE